MQKFSRFRVLVAVSVLTILVLSAFGCGSSGPKAAVEDFMGAAKDKDCEKMIDLIDLSALETSGVAIDKQELVDACKAESALGEIVSYKILEETVDGDKATVKVEVTTKENGNEQTESDTLQLNKRDGEWKISTL
ncbi:MAG: Rv0361 family membrane protein [Thermoleophilia bacterium]